MTGAWLADVVLAAESLGVFAIVLALGYLTDQAVRALVRSGGLK